MKVRDREAISSYLSAKKALIEEALRRFVPDESNYPPVLFEAMRYSLFAGGKRIRPILCLAAMEALGVEEKLRDAALPVACALEMIHTYSLIHDDLPAMDNDDFRRGKPTSHRVFGEDIAILAGDALLTEAFRLLSRKELMETFKPWVLLSVINEISYAIGCFGMIGGQVMDVRHSKTEINEETLYYIHTHKTGALFMASVKVGGLLGEAGEQRLSALRQYGEHMGLMFQIVDDLLDVEGNATLLGKDTARDAALKKITFPALIGVEKTKEKIRELKDKAIFSLSCFDERAWMLRSLAEHLAERKV